MPITALTADVLADLAYTTQKSLGEGKWTMLATSLTEYVALPKLMKSGNVDEDVGSAIQFNVMKGTSGAARNVGLADIDNVNIKDTQVRGEIPWRGSETSYAIYVDELAMNTSPRKLIDIMKLRRVDAMTDLAILMETNFWGKPSTSSDDKTPFGVAYWIVSNASEGFNGGDPSGFSSGAAGLLTATYSTWKNYTGQWTNVTKDDLVRMWRGAAVKTNFKPPVEVPEYGTVAQYGYYTNYTVLGKLEELLEDQNDNLGNDVASKDGECMFRRVPVTYVPYLDGNVFETNPVYGINWSVFRPTFLKGRRMVESKPREAPLQHNAVQTFVDLRYNFKCVDRRKCFVLDNA